MTGRKPQQVPNQDDEVMRVIKNEYEHHVDISWPIKTVEQLVEFNEQLRNPEYFEAVRRSEEHFYIPGEKTAPQILRENAKRLLHVELRHKCVIKKRKNTDPNAVILELNGDKVMELIYKSTSKAFGYVDATDSMKKSFQNLINHSKQDYRDYLEQSNSYFNNVSYSG